MLGAGGGAWVKGDEARVVVSSENEGGGAVLPVGVTVDEEEVDGPVGEEVEDEDEDC